MLRGLAIDSSIHKELAPPLFKFSQAEPNRAAHHSEMANLLSLDVSIHERRADSKKPSSRLHVHGRLETRSLEGLELFSLCVQLGCVYHCVSLGTENPMRRLSGITAGCMSSPIASNTALNWASYLLSSSSISARVLCELPSARAA